MTVQHHWLDRVTEEHRPVPVVELGITGMHRALVVRAQQGAVQAPSGSETSADLRTMTERLPEDALRVLLAAGRALENAYPTNKVDSR